MFVSLEQRRVGRDVSRLPRHACFEQPHFDLFAQVTVRPRVEDDPPIGRHP